MKPLILFASILFTLTTSCGAVDKVTNARSLDRAKSETRSEREARAQSERIASNYKQMLVRSERTANLLWIVRIDTNAPGRDEAKAACRELGFDLPKRTQLVEAEQNSNLAKIIAPSEFGGGIHLEDEDSSEKLVLKILCVK